MALRLVALCLFAVLVAIATSAAEPAFAAPPASRISLDSLPKPSGSSNTWWTVIVSNDPVPGHPPAAAYDVVVRITATANGQEYKQHGPTNEPSSGYLDSDRGEWGIPFLPPGGTATVIIRPEAFFSQFNQDTPVRLHAELVSHRYLASEAGNQGSIETEDWYVRRGNAHFFRFPGSEVGVEVNNPNRVPALGTQTTFEIIVVNTSHKDPDPTVTIVPSRTIAKVWDVKVKIDLSPGLSLAPGWTAPTGTSFDAETGVWNVGLIDGRNTVKTLSLPVLLAADNVPLEQRCLTAAVVRSAPDFALDHRVLANDFSTECLVAQPVISEGESTLFDFFSCVGVTSAPCTGTDTLELVAELPSPTRHAQPEDLLLHITPRGRTTRAGGVEVWSTARKFDLTDSQTRLPSSVWSNAREDLTVTGPGGGPLPGSFTMNFISVNIPDIVITDTTKVVGASFPTGFDAGFDLDFGTLGTYVLTMDIMATHSIAGPLTDTGVYTFHVGPIAELAVMDGGEGSPLAAAGQPAYTIHAANNGPDKAPAVRVDLVGVPEGAEAIVTDGTYQELAETCAGGLCEAEWVLGELPVSDSRPAGGQTEFPTLTLIAPTGVPAPDIQASIANSEDYSVVIDGVIHSTHYFDYIEDNNAATIMAQPGTGEGAPGVPQDLRGQFFATPPRAVVQWAEVELLNGWPVSRYQVWKFEDEPGAVCQAPRADQAGAKIEGTLYLDSRYVEDSRTCYYVRAVNTRGVPGYWSEPVAATSQGLDQPRLSLEAGPDVSEGETATFTVRASPAPVVGDTLVVYYTVADKRVDIDTVGYVDAADEGRKDVTVDNRGRATITVPTQSDDMDRPDGEVTVTLEDGLGYTLGTPDTASVAVLDDDNPTVSFAVSPTEPLSEGMQPNTHYVTVNLDRPSHAALDIHYTLGGDVGDENVRFRIAGSGRERSARVPSGVTSVDIPVRLLDDTDTRDDTVLNLFLSPRHYYDLGNPSSYTLTIIEDDGPRAEFDLAESGVDEDATGSDNPHNVVVNLNPAPTGPVTINYSISGTARRDEHYSIAGVTGSTGSVSAGAGATSVTIPVTIINNGAVEGDKTVVLTLLNSPGNYTRGDGRTHEVTIRDDDLPRASFAAGASNPGEGKGLHTVRVNLSPPAPPDGLTLRYGVGGTASRNRDYRVDNTTFALGGATGVDIWVEITDDGDNEPDETVVLTLRAGSGYAVGDPGEHTLTIADDDLPLVAFAAEDASAGERSGTHRATILVEPAAHEDFTVSYSVGGTATEGAEEDFTINGLSNGSGTVTVPARASRVQVPVTIRNDEFNEGDETVVLTLTGCDGCNLALPVRHELTIKDDDAPVVSFPEPAVTVYEDNIGTHTVRVNLDRPAERAFTLKFGVSSPLPLVGADATDYSLPDPMEAQVIVGQDYVDIPVIVTADTDNEADEIAVLTLEPGRGYSVGAADEYTLTIVDDDNDQNTPVFTMDHPAIHGTGTTHSERWEDGGSFNPTFYVTNSFTGRVYFQYVGGTATPGEDFSLFNIGDQTIEEAGDIFGVTPGAPFNNDFGRPDVYWARFGFNPRRDDKAEGSETAIFRLLNGPGYRVSGHTDYTITIRNAN